MAPLVFITGASSGIGQALAGRFYEAGYNLALVARRTSEIESWAQTRQLAVDRFRIYSADVAQIDSIVAAGADCIANQGPARRGDRQCRHQCRHRHRGAGRS